jgi:hypothetical protein
VGQSDACAFAYILGAGRGVDGNSKAVVIMFSKLHQEGSAAVTWLSLVPMSEESSSSHVHRLVLGQMR